MNNNILTIMKKEFARFFGDRRTLIAIFMPGIMIYIVYTLMGSALSGMFSADKDHVPSVYAVNMPASVKAITDKLGYKLNNINASGKEEEEAKQKLSNKEADLLMVFPADFDSEVDAFNVKTSGTPAPNIELYYNSTDENSSAAYRNVLSELDTYESSLANKFDVNTGVDDADQATKEDTSAKIISSLMPMLLLMFLFSGCMAIAPESIVGEKERGTIATLLVTPIKRSQLAIGKILSLGCLAFLCGLSSLIGTILAIPKLMGASSDNISVNIYKLQDYFFLTIIIISTILLIITVISIISAFSKSVKEATANISPLMVIVMMIGVTAMFGSGPQEKLALYLVPLYNSVQSMNGIFSLNYSAVNVLVACLCNLIYACAGGFVLTKMFNSEKVMFSK